MTPKDRGLYWAIWGRCRAALQLAGRTPEEADAERHRLHIEALGIDRGHDELSQRELALVLVRFRPVAAAGSTAGPAGEARRLRALRGRCRRLAALLGTPRPQVSRYIEHRARSVFGRAVDGLNEPQLAQLAGRLETDLAKSRRPRRERTPVR